MLRNCSKGLFMLLVLAVSGIFCNTAYAGQAGSYEYSADMVSRTYTSDNDDFVAGD